MAETEAQHNESPAARMTRRLVLLAIVGAAIGLGIWQPVEIDTLLDWGRRLAAEPLVLAAVILIQAALFSFALPGSLMLWFVAPFLTPLIAVPVLVTGSVLGALGAYFVSTRLGADWRPRRGAWLIDAVAKRGDFLTQCAFRTLPGCPHWTVSYAAGILRLPLPTFIAAAILGLSIKWSVYASALYGMGTAAEAERAIGLGDVLPLLILTVFLLLGGLLRRRIAETVAPEEENKGEDSQ